MVTAATLAGGALDYDNGVVHTIDMTLVPATENIVSIAVAASQASEGAEFGQLVAALTAVENDGSTDALVTILSGDGAFTVFAPTDAAFQALYAAASVADFNALVEAVGIGTIETVLKYHVLPGNVFSSDIPNALDGNTSVELTPLAGGNFTLNSDLTITDTDGALGIGTADASIIDTDIFGTNGVIHVIDQVILP
jgi:transforming growth factor-beta-induced protein